MIEEWRLLVAYLKGLPRWKAATGLVAFAGWFYLVIALAWAVLPWN